MKNRGLATDSPLWDVWESIKAFYPGSTAGWDSEPPMMWAHVLNDLSYDQLANGVKNLIHHRDSRGANDFPPNAGQFRDLCLTNFNWERQCHREFEPDRLLEDHGAKEAAKAAGEKALSEINAMWGES